jgi:hypothetical protein
MLGPKAQVPFQLGGSLRPEVEVIEVKTKGNHLIPEIESWILVSRDLF